MIKSLRKRHLQIWSIMLILLPATILFGVIAIPRRPISRSLLQPNSVPALPTIAGTVDKTNYTVNIRVDYDSSHLQLEWINKTPLTTPSAIIYKALPARQGQNNAKELIGRIESRGTYYFALKKGHGSFKPVLILYDFIHDKAIDTINF